MATTTVLICLQALLVQSALSRCIGPIEPAGPGCGFVPSASSGGSFVVTSSSPVAPIGVSVVSENVYEGSLCAGGNLPLLGAVGVEGEFPTAGAGAVSYGCGDDGVAIIAEDASAAVVAPVVTGPLAFSTPLYGFGFGSGLGYGYGIGYGYNGIYGYNGFGSGLYGFNGCGCI